MEETGVVFDEESDVFDAPFNHSKAVESHTKSKARDVVGVVVAIIARVRDRFKNSGVDDAATSDFNPFGLLAFDMELDVDFVGGFGEGEEVGAEAKLGVVTEERLEELFEGAF